MYLSSYEKQKIIQYLERYTDYDVAFLLDGKSDMQIQAMYRRIKDAMSKYPKEIFDYLSTHPLVEPRYTLEELVEMTYNELSELRANYGLKGRKKKVVKTEVASEKLVNRAKMVVQNTEAKGLIRDVLLNNACSRDEEQERDFEILSEEEIRMMYGEDLSRDELFGMGIILDTVPRESYSDADAKRERLIDAILDEGVSIGKKKLTLDELFMMSEEDLVCLHEIVQTIKSSREPKRLRK